jgi:hypothetical protein
MAKADILAGRAYVSLFVKKSDFKKALDAAKKDLDEFGKKLMSVGAGIAAAGGAITGSLTGTLLHFAKVGDELDKMSLRTGVSSTALAELGFAAEQSGASMETVESALKRMARNLGEIGPESIKTTAALEAIGLSAERLQGLAPEDQFQLIADRIGSIQDPTKRAAAAMAVFGEGGRQLLPMLENMRELRQEARDLGIAPSPESVAAAAQITDAINRVRRVIGAVMFEIGAAVAPMAEEVLSGFLQMIGAVRKFIVANKPLIVTIAKVGATLLAVGTAITALGSLFVGAGLVLGAVSAAMSGFAAAIGAVISLGGIAASVIGMLLTPVGLITVALVAGAVAWVKFTDSGKNAVATLVGSVTGLFGQLRQTVTDTMGGIVTAIQAGDLALAGRIAMVGLRLVFMQGLDAINGLFGEAIGSIVGKLLSGDISGAIATLGSTILDSWAQITSGLVGLMTSAANLIADKWAQTANKIANKILEMAAQGGVVGKLFEQVTGVNMQEETQRAQRLEAERRAKGLKPQTDGIDSQIAAGNFQDPAVQAIKDRIKAITAQIDEGREAVTDATGQALDDATAGQAEATSANIRKLQDELDSLRKQATEKLEAGKKIGGDDEEEIDGFEGGGTPSRGMSGRGSVATNNLMALQSAMTGPQDRQVKLAEDANKKADKQIEVLQQVAGKIDKMGLFHA